MHYYCQCKRNYQSKFSHYKDIAQLYKIAIASLLKTWYGEKKKSKHENSQITDVNLAGTPGSIILQRT